MAVVTVHGNFPNSASLRSRCCSGFWTNSGPRWGRPPFPAGTGESQHFFPTSLAKPAMHFGPGAAETVGELRRWFRAIDLRAVVIDEIINDTVFVRCLRPHLTSRITTARSGRRLFTRGNGLAAIGSISLHARELFNPHRNQVMKYISSRLIKVCLIIFPGAR